MENTVGRWKGAACFYCWFWDEWEKAFEFGFAELTRGIGRGILGSMLHIVLFQPEIPQNTGNVGRLCAVTRCRLHLIHPLGFEITDRHLKRSGMDYWHSLDVHHHENWESFRASGAGPERIWLFTTKTTRGFWDVSFRDGDGLLFGRETSGCPEWLREEVGEEAWVTIPRFNEEMRSLNLSTSVGIATYEALRQLRV